MEVPLVATEAVEAAEAAEEQIVEEENKMGVAEAAEAGKMLALYMEEELPRLAVDEMAVRVVRQTRHLAGLRHSVVGQIESQSAGDTYPFVRK